MMRKHRMDIRDSYKNFYSKFVLVVHGNGKSPHQLQFSSSDNGNGIISVHLKEPIFLSKWPIAKKIPHQSVDISVCASFRYNKENLLLTRSSVYLTYFKRDMDKKVAEPFKNLRFDYHPDADDGAHPLMHAHVFCNGIPDLEPSFLRGYDIKWDIIKRDFDSFRVPVPNMNLPSVLLCLVACHLGAGKVKDLLSKTQDQRKEFPHLDISQGQIDLLKNHSFAGFQWFERP